MNELDVFLLANALLFLLMCALTYHDRWVAYVGEGRSTEFVIYAVLILMGFGVLRALLPRWPVPAGLLVLVEAGILMHFAGGFVHIGGARLYDHHFLGLRYDKYVHTANAFIGAVSILHLCRVTGLPLKGFTRCLAFFAVLGLGAAIEVVEFVVTRTVPRNGIGGYEDTALDLVSNIVGGLLFLCVGAWALRRLDPGARRGAEVLR